MPLWIPVPDQMFAINTLIFFKRLQYSYHKPITTDNNWAPGKGKVILEHFHKVGIDIGLSDL